MKMIFITFMLFLSNYVISQTADTTISNTGTEITEPIYTQTETMPEFPGGNDSLNSFLRRNIVFPDKAKEAGVYGNVWVTFLIDEKGKVKNIKILRGLGYGCEEEVLKTIAIMPDWVPGKQNCKPVRVQMNLPISFRVH